jgi:predicted nucleic acid-binding protein
MYYRGAQPEGADYAALAKLGVKTVIDLQADGLAHEAGLVNTAGMTYVRIPMTTRVPPTETQIPSERAEGTRRRAARPVGWLIDTSLWIAVERGALSAADIHAITLQEPVQLSPVNVAEIRFGLDLLRAGPQKQRAAAMFRRLCRKPQLRITVETADTFDRLAAGLKKSGRDPHVRVNDLWPAAQAIQRDFHLLTANAKDFRDIPGLQMTAVEAAIACRLRLRGCAGRLHVGRVLDGCGGRLRVARSRGDRLTRPQ